LPRGKAHYRVTFEDALEAHHRALTFGGAPGIVSEHSIKSAIDRPYDGYHLRIYSKVAALTEALVRNHGFVDGNKRTAIFMLNNFLLRSGYCLVPRLEQADNRELEEIILAIAQSGMDFNELRAWFKENIARRD
jgi:death-on-curing protein